MEVIKYRIEGLIAFKPRIFTDDRGYFFESFNEKIMREHIGDFNFVQDNQSSSHKNVLRGLHFQKPPYDQGKLVRVISGEVLDVAVDIRKNSPTYGQYEKVLLTGENNVMFWIPPGFAHGFLSLKDDSIFSYKCTNFYNKESEDAIIWNDPEIGIDWEVEYPLVSEKDDEAKTLKEFESPFIL
ncbi:dTDP-4-dehydrorhamnose 3,5-epimerase [Paracrocinitomix mangrovi]|uniref:dTDP-4-dehydrorhamnose 3,5-epimerase n=1 Tax=Paracrocinitomix mangrovi TaxID=2862509 RepID=UPI001C8D9DE5|nr:dTDP-4-dehydrorhamnose 3,5-epimerase [Paracrocinitomix mangrovi]UKN02221.1 dTDP-4-dehydrorhamnose 3,5-epimerase [Paracrocinitomix mangrovi]